MAKVPYSKLKCKTNEEIKTIDIDGVTIEIKQYLPIQEKLELMGRVIELAHDQDYNYSNPIKANVIRDLEILFAYTNLTFTDKQKEDIAKLYDQLYSNNILTRILVLIPKEEIEEISNGIEKTIESVYKYQNSVLGILDTIKTDYNNMKLDIDSLSQAITDPETLEFVKSILTNLN